MNDAVRKITLEDMMNMMIEMMKINQTYQKEMMNAATQSLQSQSEKPMAESHHIDISTDGYNDAHSNMSTDGHINFAKDVADEEIKDSHTNISTDGYVDDAPCGYKVVPIDEDMSTNDHFQEQSCENNTMEEPSAVEELIVFEDAAEASIIATDLKSRTIHASTPVTATTILFASCQKPASVHVGTAKNVATAASHQRFAVHKSEPAMQTTTLATIAEATRHRSFLLPLYAITAPICIWTSRCHNCISAPVRAAKSPEYSSSRSHHHRTYSSPLQQIHHLLASFAPAASIAAASSFTLQ
ncbi:hypothetical protein DEO72_LG2g1755 [Vigna unguiculata]|uniref:Uncharacterized protein n=1 Tax=Vigna unguiculata TaxID=3917 RepID=A0A4D6KZJ5_VIGUN|nr:hypothetical protein DEO72_LG2g1755 [Vigna unguiculata]